MTDFPYHWVWKKWLPKYHGKRCRVLCRLARNSAIIEFEDGYWTCTSRNGLRRVKEKTA